jgi:putative nucleotidyltransferase with HDIG domain
MTGNGEADYLRERIKAFLLWLKPQILAGDADLNRLSQLRRLSDVRIRQFSLGRPKVVAADLGGLLMDPKGGARFDAIAGETGLLRQADLQAPLTPLGEEMGYLVEACLSLQLVGTEKMCGYVLAFVQENGIADQAAPAPVEAAPAAPPSSEAPLPPQVEKLLGGVKDLWSMPANAQKILDMLSRQDTPIEAVCGDLERDPGLSSQCLRVVNSAYYGAAQKIASVKRAVVMLGYQTTRRIVSLSALTSKLGRAHGEFQFDLKSYWGHCLWVAQAASLVAKETGLGQPDDHFTAGIIHDVGKLVEYQYLRAPMQLILKAVRQGTAYDAAEEEILGVTHAVIGACVCDRWNFPKSVVEAARHHLDPAATLEEMELPREAFVVAAMCAMSHTTLPEQDLNRWCELLRVSVDRLKELRGEATQLTLGSLKDVFVYA